MGLILTVPPLAKFGEIAKHKAVEAVRVNTTHKLDLNLEDVLSQIRQEAGAKEVWVDLKCRQLRITDYVVKFKPDCEEHYIELSHNIKLETPTEAWIDNGNYRCMVSEVKNGNVLVIRGSVEKGTGLPLPNPQQVGIRPGMSVNILDPSLKIEGYLTPKDKEYIAAAKKLGIHNYMLSFVEQESDLEELLSLDDKARIVAKIESQEGLDFVKTAYGKYRGAVHLMAARGDLYLQLARPDLIIDACGDILIADPEAIFASRMYESLQHMDKAPVCSELFDVYAALAMGYKRFMIGDEVSRSAASTVAAIKLFEMTTQKYEALK